MEKGSLVKLVGMDYEYSTGFDKSWMEGAVGTIVRYDEVTNVNYGNKSVLCIVNLLVPFLSVTGEKIEWVTVNGRNLKEIHREAIVREAIKGGIS